MKMKYPAVIILCCTLIACQKNAGSIKKNGPADPPALRLWAGADSTVALSTWELTGNSFTISNDHPDIAQVTTDHKNLKVHAYKPGKATITITNDQQKQFKVLVQPVDMLSNNPGNWVSAAKDGMKSYVTVITNNQKLTDSLYQALWRKLDDKGANGIFRYAFTTGQFFFTAATTPRVDKEGSWTYDQLRLTLTYADSKEIYQIIPLQSIYLIELRRTLTAELQQQFPDAGITEVSTHQYFAYHRFL
ncbi:hypothetical protein LQ567_09510 [Niabella pedocola]|uniref:BIG2 domain-containing protein n=1 Tax=Niabella pedocola TaxID=1752077 RepID=A0ABS8PPG9_9BACT|nr:hypothetical protein [Niabella pedocola]MCD2422998.1 hypothetical protein [Niabella pedocola]